VHAAFKKITLCGYCETKFCTRLAVALRIRIRQPENYLKLESISYKYQCAWETY